MTTIPTEAGPAAEPGAVTGTVMVRQPSAAAATGAQRRKATPVDGALLWSLVRRYLSFYVAFRTEAELDRVTAWVFHACARNRGKLGMGPPIWSAVALLLIKSRTRGAGKSTLLRLITLLTGSKKSPRITPARFAQTTGQAYETVCIDEGRHVFGAGASHIDLQACILESYQPGSYHRVSKTDLPLFGYVAIATKESLITEAYKAVDSDESSIGDILDRCLSVTLTAPEFPMPEVGARAEAQGEVLRRALIAWTDVNQDALQQAAQDIADEDLKAARERAAAGERATETPRALQIGRPLRAIGKVIDQQARSGGQPDPEPQHEAGILACLGSQTEDIMGELEDLSGHWGDSPAVFTGDEADYGDSYGDYSQPAPSGQFTAGYTQTRNGKTSEFVFTTMYPSLEDAQRACADHAEGPLHWNPNSDEPGMWKAVFYEGGTEFTYMAGEIPE